MAYSLFVWLIGSQACHAEIIPYDPNTMQYPISVEQAMQAARDWAENPNLTFLLKGISISSWDPTELPHLYMLRTTDNLQRFEVDCYTGEMRHWCDIAAEKDYLSKQDEHWPESNQLPVAELNATVLQFLTAKYANFASLNLVHTDPGSTSSWYIQKLPNGARYIGNNAGSAIDEWSGTIVNYFGRHSPPPTISTEPTLTSEQAEQIALDYAGTMLMHDADSEDMELLVHPQSAFVLQDFGLAVGGDGMGTQRLDWGIEVVVHVQPGYTAEEYAQELSDPLMLKCASGEEVDILVDAHTGEVFYAEPGGYMGSPPKPLSKFEAANIKARKPNPSAVKDQLKFEKGNLELDGLIWRELMFPPRAVGKTGYIYAKYIPVLYGGTIKWASGVAELVVAGKLAKIRPGSKQVEVGGKQVHLAHPPMIIAGRLYIPAEAIKPMCGAESAWDAKERVLSITSGDLKVKPQFRRPVLKARQESE